MSDNKFFAAITKYCKGRGLKLNEDQVKEDLSVNDNTSNVDSDSQLEVKKSHDLAQQISVEILAEPYAPDAHDQWYSKETIEKGYDSAKNAIREGRLHMNLFHEIDDVDAENVELLKHYLVPFDCEVNGQQVKEGSWICEVKWHNEALWKMRTEPNEETGKVDIAGLSLRGWGTVYKEESEEE